jgi:hypothetical protein
MPRDERVAKEEDPRRHERASDQREQHERQGMHPAQPDELNEQPHRDQKTGETDAS